MALLTIVVAVVAALLTYYITFDLKRGAVFGSAVVTLIAGILFKYVTPEWAAGMGAVAAAGSYAAMVAKERFPRLSDMIYVGIVCGIVFVISSDVFAGVGGKLGTIAAISGFTVLGVRTIRKKMFA